MHVRMRDTLHVYTCGEIARNYEIPVYGPSNVEEAIELYAELTTIIVNLA